MDTTSSPNQPQIDYPQSATIGPPTYPDISPDEPLNHLTQNRHQLPLRNLAAGGLIVTGLMAALFMVKTNQDIRQRAAQEPTAISFPQNLPYIPAPTTATLVNINTPDQTTTLTWNNPASLQTTHSFYTQNLEPSGWTITQNQPQLIISQNSTHTLTLEFTTHPKLPLTITATFKPR